MQVAEDLRIAGARLGTRVLTVYGGRAYEPQIESLRTGVDVVVGTPGRLLGPGRPASPRPVRRAHARARRGGPDARPRLPARRGADPEARPERAADDAVLRHDAARGRHPGPAPPEPAGARPRRGSDEPEHAPDTEHHVFRIHHLDKIEVLARVLQADRPRPDHGLLPDPADGRPGRRGPRDRGFAVASVHGDLGQGQRERALRAFRNGKVDVLVATDVAARGLDVDDVTHVVNYECPEDDKAYLHRTGRTGRAGRTGIAVTFVNWRDMHRWKLIDESLGLGCPEPTETYSTSEHLFGALRIPETATGTLPVGQRDRAGLGAEAIEDIGETGRVRSQRTQSPPGRGAIRTRPDRRRQERGRPGPRHPGRRRRPRPVRTRESLAGPWWGRVGQDRQGPHQDPAPHPSWPGRFPRPAASRLARRRRPEAD